MLLVGIIACVAFLHLYFMYLEMFLWTKPKGLRIFGQSLEQAKSSAQLAFNQGLYNGFLSAGLIWGLVAENVETAKQVQIFFLICVIVAGLVGGITVNKKLFFIQAGPAIVALALIFAL